MKDDRPVEAATDALRRSRTLAAAAMLLLLTSLWLPWWLVRYTAQGLVVDEVTVGLFSPSSPASTQMPWLTAALVVAATAWLFVRVAARSIVYEPDAWRRDIAIQAALVAAALLSCIFWPDQVPFFWGGQTYGLGNATGSFSEEALPGLGFWCAAAAFVLLAAATALARIPRIRQ